MLKSIFLYSLAFVICGACVYFFDQRNYLAAAVLLIIAVSTLFGRRIGRFADALDTVMKYPNLERHCNCALQMNIAIESLLQHKAVAELFERIQSKGMITDDLTTSLGRT